MNGLEVKDLKSYDSGIMMFYRILMVYLIKLMKSVKSHPPLNPLPSREGERQNVKSAESLFYEQVIRRYVHATR